MCESPEFKKNRCDYYNDPERHAVILKPLCMKPYIAGPSPEKLRENFMTPKYYTVFNKTRISRVTIKIIYLCCYCNVLGLIFMPSCVGFAEGFDFKFYWLYVASVKLILKLFTRNVSKEKER